MSVVALPAHPWMRALKRFFKSPKGYLLLVLAPIVVVAALGEEPSRVAPGLVAGVLAAALADVAIVLWGRGVWMFPSGAILTGLLVALVMSPTEPVVIVAATSVIAISSKYVFRTRWSNVFNPAALALVIAFFAFGSGESWWGALADLPVWWLPLLVACGLFLADRINKLPMVLTFLAVFFAVFTASAFLGDPSRVAEIFRVPDANAALFFALFMLDDPPTSPVRYADQVVYAIIVAVVSFAVFVTIGAEYYLLAGVLVGNAWESLRRSDEHTGARAAAPYLD